MHALAKLALFGLTARAAVVGGNRSFVTRDGTTPSFDYDAATTKYCSFWYDNVDGSIACEDMPEKMGITEDQWKRWVSFVTS